MFRKITPLKIQKKDASTHKKMVDLLYSLENHVKDLRRALAESDILSKEQDYDEISGKLLSLQEGADDMFLSLYKLESLEDKHPRYDTPKDDDLLKEKGASIQRIKESIKHALGIFDERPSIQELKEGLFEEIVEEVNSLVDELNLIKDINDRLMLLYKDLF